jgi:hypothetical protein
VIGMMSVCGIELGSNMCCMRMSDVETLSTMGMRKVVQKWFLSFREWGFAIFE